MFRRAVSLALVALFIYLLMCHEVNITCIAILESDVLASVFPTLTATLESYELCE